MESNAKRRRVMVSSKFTARPWFNIINPDTGETQLTCDARNCSVDDPVMTAMFCIKCDGGRVYCKKCFQIYKEIECFDCWNNKRI